MVLRCLLIIKSDGADFEFTVVFDVMYLNMLYNKLYIHTDILTTKSVSF